MLCQKQILTVINNMKLGQYNNIIMSVIGVLGLVLTIILGANQMGILFVISLACLALFVIGYIIYAFLYLTKNAETLSRFINYITLPKSNFIILKREIFYEFIDRTHMIHIKKIKLRSMIDNLHEFTDRYKWSKNVECYMEELIDEQTISKKWSDVHWHYYSIILDKYYKKGDEFDTGIIMPNLIDEKKESTLFLSTGIFDPTKELVLKVKISNTLEIESAKVSVYKSYFDLSAASIVQLTPVYNRDSAEIIFTCKYPLMGAKYIIQWCFKNEDCWE